MFPPGQPRNLAPGFSWRSPRATQVQLRSGTPDAAAHLARSLPPVRAHAGAPDPAPAYFAAVAHAEEVILQHLHGGGPGGVDERPPEDVRQGLHRGDTQVSGGAQRGVGGRRRSHGAEARRGLRAAGRAAEWALVRMVLPPLSRANA